MTKHDANEPPNVGEDIIRGLKELRDTLRDGTPLEERFEVRCVEQPDPDAT